MSRLPLVPSITCESEIEYIEAATLPLPVRTVMLPARSAVLAFTWTVSPIANWCASPDTGLAVAVSTAQWPVASERVYVGYSQSLDATGGGWELVYKIAKRLTVRLETGEQTAIDLVWTWRWG